MRYPALIEGGGDDYGVTFPDLPGCVAMGQTVDEVILNAEEALHDWMEGMEELGHEIPAPSELEEVEVPVGSALKLTATHCVALVSTGLRQAQAERPLE